MSWLSSIECIDHGYKGDEDGYALTTGRFNGERRTYRVHRKVCADKLGLTLDEIKGKVVMHTCDNPRCINPEHLQLGTHGDNQRDKVNKNRQAKGSKHGRTILSPEQVAYVRSNYVKYSRNANARTIAEELGVSISCILDITTGKNWEVLC